MIKPQLPEGMNEDDYEAIEAAVMETVRGRWFLAEFARRSHIDEMRHMLDAMARLEQAVTTHPAVPADPSIRLIVSRLKEVGAQLDKVAADMRGEGVETAYCAAIESQARALSGLLRLNVGADPQPAKIASITIAPVRSEMAPTQPLSEARSAAAPIVMTAPTAPQQTLSAPGVDRRRAALASIDQLSTMEKLKLFA